jgi:hypothetical protein
MRCRYRLALPPGVSGIACLPTEEDIVPPSVDEPLSFERNVKQLFRAKDQESMSSHFDLFSYNDVRQHADAILNRLRAGTMPCDGAWPEQQVDTFARWVDTGKAP